MNGKMTLFIDQYGSKIWARTVRDLREKAGGGRVFKIYVDKTVGGTFHCGYGVGKRWFTAYHPVELAA